MKSNIIYILIAISYIGCSGNFKNAETYCKCAGQTDNFTKDDIKQCDRFWKWIAELPYETLDAELSPILVKAKKSCPETYRQHSPYGNDSDLDTQELFKKAFPQHK